MKSYILLSCFSIFNIFRRFYWNHRYKRHPELTCKVFLQAFRHYLSCTPSQASRRDKEEGALAGFTLAPVTVDGYIRIVKKIVRDQGTIFPTKRQMQERVAQLKNKRASSMGLIERDPHRAGRNVCYWPTSVGLAAI